MLLAKIEWGKLAELIIAAPIAGLTVAASFALVILGTSRFADSRRDGAMAVALAYGGLALVGGAAFLGACAFGIFIILNK